jgi:hypothetical protein
MNSAIKKKITLHIPYAVAGLLATNFGEAWRLTEGVDPSRKVLTLMTTLQTAFVNPLPSFHTFDLMIGVICALVFYLAVYMRGKNAKKYRHNTEQVARCGNNLNQYAKRANENGSIYAADIMDLQEQFQEILDTERSIFLKLAALK